MRKEGRNWHHLVLYCHQISTRTNTHVNARKAIRLSLAFIKQNSSISTQLKYPYLFSSSHLEKLRICEIKQYIVLISIYSKCCLFLKVYLSVKQRHTRCKTTSVQADPLTLRLTEYSWLQRVLIQLESNSQCTEIKMILHFASSLFHLFIWHYWL